MIPRYSLPEMARLWTDEARFASWLEVELLAVEGWASIGVIPETEAAELREVAGFSTERIQEIERTTNHDVAAFVAAVAETAGKPGRWIHYGLTSSDVVDTALACTLKQALELLVEKARLLLGETRDLAFRHRATPCVGRTHGVHAEVTTFGAKLASWVFEIARDIRRLESARDSVATGKLSGAVGNYSAIDPAVEAYVCNALGLRPEPAATQVVARDRHAEAMWAIAVTGASLERFAQEIRHLQRTEVREVEEPFGVGQKGSSAMPHKRNPIICERICGLARLLRANLGAALEDVALWHERDISHSSVERVILPDSTILLHYLLDKMCFVVREMRVYPDRMLANIEATNGLVFSQQVLLRLVETGMSRETAYAIVQRNAMKSWESGESFRDLVAKDPDSPLGESELSRCFELDATIRALDPVFERLEAIEAATEEQVEQR